MTKRTTKTRSRKAVKSNAWFKPVRGSYLPVHWAGWLTYIPYIVYLYATYALLIPNRPILETIIFLVPYWVAGILIMHWIAKLNS